MTPELIMTVAGIVGSVIIATVGLTLKITGEFSRTRAMMYEGMEKVKTSFQTEIEKHEAIDERRHESNIDRFEKINQSLARLEK